MKRYNYIVGLVLLFILSVSFTACDKEEVKTSLNNKCIKRSLGPNVCGQQIEFAYATAIPPEMGKLVSAQVEASIAGATDTWLEHHSYHTKLDGIDTAIVVANPCVNTDNITKVEFSVDTCAATLRYYYVIPEAAKGKKVSFIFSAVASNGEKVSIKMGDYEIATMDMKLDLNLTSTNCYISIEDMAVYNATSAAAIPNKIDLVFLYRDFTADSVKFDHAFVAPAADASKYLPGISLPSGVNRNTKIRVVGIKDAHLARLNLKKPAEDQPSIYLDDMDLRDMDMTNMPNWALDIINNDGMFVETQDGKYKAYIFANNMRTGRGQGTISIKRYTVY
ncbi:MAG: DUF4466 family protein [Paludibacter sp.]